MPTKSQMDPTDAEAGADAKAGAKPKSGLVADPRLSGWRDVPRKIRTRHLGFERRRDEVIDRLTRRPIGRVIGGRFVPRR